MRDDTAGSIRGTWHVLDPLRAESAGIDPSQVRPLRERPQMAHVSMVIDDATVDGTELGAFITAYAQLLRLTRTVRPGAWEHRTQLPAGEAARPYLKGLLVEHYHYIDGAAAKHAGMLLAPGDRHSYLAARRHLTEEAEHVDLVAEALRRWPEGPIDPTRTRALGATDALLGWQAQIGLRWGPRGYFAAASLAEVHPEVASRTPNPWRSLAARCGVNAEVLAPLAEHFDLDRDAGHGSTIQDLLEGRTIPVETAVDYVAILPATDAALGHWHSAMHEHYHRQSQPPLSTPWPFEDTPGHRLLDALQAQPSRPDAPDPPGL